MLEFTKEPELKHTKIDVRRLKAEINSLAGELKFLKGRIRDPELNKAVLWGKPYASCQQHRREFDAAQQRHWKTARRFNKLVTLRSLMRGKIHFHKNTNLRQLYYLPGISEDVLWKWVLDVRKEFKIK